MTRSLSWSRDWRLLCTTHSQHAHQVLEGLCQEFANGNMVGIWANNRGVHLNIKEVSLNVVSVQTSPSLNTPGICWQGLIHVSLIFSLHVDNQAILSEFKLRCANNYQYLFDRRLAKSNALTDRRCVQRSAMYKCTVHCIYSMVHCISTNI